MADSSPQQQTCSHSTCSRSPEGLFPYDSVEACIGFLSEDVPKTSERMTRWRWWWVAMTCDALQQHHQHWALFKPDDVLSQFVMRGKVKQRHRFLGDLGHDFPEGTMAVGRLDRMTEGLLLLTTDGKVSRRVTAGRVEKEYWAEVDGVVDDAAVAALAEGVEIGVRGDRGRERSEAYVARALRATRLDAPPALPPRRRKVPSHRPHSWLAITVVDGKYHQIRKMTAAVGFPTLRLVRARVGHLRLGDMRPGDVRPLDADALGPLATGDVVG